MTELLEKTAADTATARIAKDADKPLLLFVCTGNTCRSPMAAALYNYLSTVAGGTYTAASAGLWAMAGDPITPLAADALAKAGISSTPPHDYRAHRATPVSAELMQRAALVVGLTGTHAMELLMRYPEHAGKITTLPADVADPFGGDAAIYDTCCAQLEQLLRTLFFAGDTDAHT